MTGLPSKTVEIDRDTYTITTLDARAARRIWVPLFKAVGAGLESFDGKDEASIAKFFGRIVQSLPTELVDEMADTYGRACTVRHEGKEPKVADVAMFHFAGRPAHWVKWLVECTKVNFADFLDGSSTFSLSALQAAASK